MTTNQLTDEQREREGGAILRGLGWGFCQAVAIEGPAPARSGGTAGSARRGSSIPAASSSSIVLTQRMFTSPVPPPIHAELQAAAYAALG